MKNYKKYKNFLSILFLFFCAEFIFAQKTAETPPKGTIDLPDVSTTIEGEDSTVDKAAVPDFNLILPEREDDFLLSVKLPEAEDVKQKEALAAADAKKTPRIGLEGLIGGGYPGYILGNFSVFQKDDKNPFEIRFLYEGKNGLGRHAASAGFMQTKINLSGYKIFTIANIFTLGISLQYKTQTEGLQGKSPVFFDMSNRLIGGALDFGVQLPKNWSFDVKAEAEFVGRFTGYNNLPDPAPPIPSEAIVFALKAGGGIYWKPNFMELSFTGAYQYFDIKLQQNTYVNRGNFYVGFLVPIKEILNLGGKLGIVVSDEKHNLVLVPFDLSIDVKQTYMILNFIGGLKSGQTPISDFDQYRFTHFSIRPKEEPVWFFNFDSAFPLFQKLSLNAALNFEQTAFGVGKILPDYNSPNTFTGLYNSSPQNRTDLNTSLGISGEFGIFGFSAEWTAFWLDAPLQKNKQEIEILTSVVSSKALWGIQVGLRQGLSGDYIPDLFASAYYQITPAFQLEVQFHDMVKLVSGKDRVYAGHFIRSSGLAALFAKINL